ncbi:MAG: hypothetical protein AAGB31_16185 [Bdellovibrio sp.]
MNFRLYVSVLVSIALLPFASVAGDFEEDLYWYKSSLSFAKIPEDSADDFLNPFKGPTEFRLTEKYAPWAGNYFPMAEGGIAQRWQTGHSFKKIHTKKAIVNMTAEQRRKLSPVEKYDIYKGFYDFRTTQHEIFNRGVLREPSPEEWEGFCNGVRCAGFLLDEPIRAVEVENRDGVRVVFEPADLKALAGASYFYTEDYAQLGSPSQRKKAESQPNPVVFDMVLRHRLARHKKPFVIDSNLSSEIWNETVVGFNREIRSVTFTAKDRELYPSAEKKVRVDVILDTLGEVDIAESNLPTKEKVANGSLLDTVETSYYLFLDSNNKALDGRWVRSSGDRGVDFVWFAAGRGRDKQYADQGGNPFLEFKTIRKLIKEAAKPMCENALEG